MPFSRCQFTSGDNGISGKFNFTKSVCLGNDADNTFKCCMTKAQVDSQLPVLTCPAKTQMQNCQCLNKSDGSFNCSCLRSDTGIKGSFNFASNLCLAPTGNLSSSQCCLSADQVNSQIPRKSCVAEAAGSVPQFCSCKNITWMTTQVVANKTVNVTNSVLNCNCMRDDFLINKNYNMSSTACLCTSPTKCECCMSPAQQADQIPKLQCSAQDVSQLGCSCTNSTNADGTLSYSCSCGIQYQSQTYTVTGLDSKKNGCMCNTTACGCCITSKQIEVVTEKQCAANEFRSTCPTCVSFFNNKTNSTQYNCSSCATYTSKFTVNNQIYNNVASSSCLCRSPSSNCTCCLTAKPASPVQAQCKAPNAEAMPNCACNTFLGGNATGCDCSRITTTGVEYYYSNISASSCSCLSVSRPAGGKPFQCACCAATADTLVAAPTCNAAKSTVQTCSCVNQNDSLNCDCAYKTTGVVLKNQNFGMNECGCPNNNATLRQCGCCVAEQTYRDYVTPSCQPGDPLATCACTNATVGTNKQVNCNCTADLKTQTASVSIVKTLIPQSQCGCYANDLNGISCKCCMKETTLLTPLDTKCTTANFLNATCDCDNQQNCSCALRSSSVTYFADSVKVAASSCNCASVNTSGLIAQKCSCCVNKTAALAVKAPVCNTNMSSSQQCDCKLINGVFTCDCNRKVGGVSQVRTGLELDKSQCACVNQTVNGQANNANCTCCVPNPPPTLCETLAAPSSSNLGCRCNYVILGGKATFSCDCSAKVNATHTLTKNNMLFDENTCCCTEKTDPVTRKGFKSCNCTQPATFQKQRCDCKPADNSTNATKYNCNCNDCNSVQTAKTVTADKCQCKPVFNTQPANPPSQANTTIKQIANSTASNATTNATSNTTKPASNTTNSSSNTTKPATNTTNATSNTTKPVTNTTTNTTSNTTKPATNATTNSTSNTTKPATNATTNSTSNTTKPATNATSNSTSNTTKPATNVTSNSNATTNTTKPASNATSNSTNNATAGNATKPNTTVSNSTNATTNTTKPANNTPGTNATNVTTNGTKPNATSNTSAPSNATNGTKPNSTVPAGNATGNTTTNGTKTNTTSNSTTNGTKSNTTVPSTNATNTTKPATNNTSNATTNGTKPATNATSNSTTNGTKPGTNTTTNVTGNATTNGTKPNSTVPTNATNATSNATKPNSTNTTVPPPAQPVSYACACDIEFSGLCPPVDFLNQPIDEGSCDAANNKPKPPTPVANPSCKYQYEYLVAVVATGKDASVLMQLQSYQMQFGQYLKLSLVSVFVIASAFLFY